MHLLAEVRLSLESLEGDVASMEHCRPWRSTEDLLVLQVESGHFNLVRKCSSPSLSKLDSFGMVC